MTGGRPTFKARLQFAALGMKRRSRRFYVAEEAKDRIDRWVDGGDEADLLSAISALNDAVSS